MTDEISATDQGLVSGDVVVVTGAAQGIGRAESIRLAAGGARIVIWDVDQEGGTETVELCRELGAEARFDLVDVGDASRVGEAADAIASSWGVPFALVNNASIWGKRTYAVDLSFDTWDRVLRTNLTGHFLCSCTFGRQMLGQRRGRIINTASGRAFQGAVGGIHYAASKAGILSLTKTLALEFAPHGIRVNCVVPGITETAQPLEGVNSLEELRLLGTKIPLGRIGQPEDVAGIVAFLLSRDSAYMTGQAIGVNGGAVMIP